MKDLLQSLIALSEGETKDTKTGRVHKGTYGSEYETDKDGNEKKKDKPTAVKKGRGRPKKDSDESGEVKKYDTSALSSVFGGGKKPKKDVGTVSKKHSLKEYIDATEQSIQEGMTAPVEIKPASQTQTQVIQQGGKTLGTVNNPQLAAQIKQSIGKGEMTLNPDEQGMAEEVDMGQADAHKSVKSEPKGDWDKDFREKLKQFTRELAQHQAQKQGQVSEGARPDFTDVDDDDNETESWTKAEKDKANKKKVAEGRDLESSEYLDEKVARVLAREKPGMDTVKSNDAFYGAIYNELIACGLTPKAARYKVSYDEDFISDVASAYAHYQKNPSLDEGSFEDFTQHALAEPTQNFTKPGSPMAQPRGTQTQANRPVPNPTPWGTDPIAAATDRAFNFVSSLGKGTKFTKESNEDMKDVQFESWEKQLNGLLTEGITVSSSQGQQGSPDSVSVTATDTDAQSLMSVLRNAGIGGFGAEQAAPEIGYGVAQGGEEEPTGTGTEPQAAPDVVGDDGDMLSMLKKMAGLSAGPVGGDEGGQDYEDEEGQETGGEEQAQTLEPASSDEEGSEEKEETDEGNAFGQEVRQKKADNIPDSQQRITTGGQNLPVKEEGEHECNECGMMESSCECDSEQVEEAYANEPDEELAKLKALLSMGNDLHKMKRDQTVGNPTQVRESINEWKKLSGIIR